MHPQLVPLAEILRLNQRLFTTALAGVPPSDTARRVGENGNSLPWVAGHATNSRTTLSRIAGARIDPFLPDLFGRGAVPKPAAAYPDLATILGAWGEATAALDARLEALADADLRKDAPFKLPVADGSILGAMAFLPMHESYHVGQLGYIRRLLGCETLAG